MPSTPPNTRAVRIIPFALLGFSFGPGPILAQQPDTLQIGIMGDRITPEVRPLIEGLLEEITNLVNAEAEISFSEQNLYSVDFDLDRAAEAYEAMVRGEPDIILAFGPVSNEVVAGRPEYPKPTMVFGGLNQDLTGHPPDRPTSGIHNFTYVVTSRSYERDLASFRDLVGFQNVGIVLPTELVELLPVLDALDASLADLGATYELIPFESPASLDPFLGRIDAVYFAETFAIPEGDLRQMAERLLREGLPSFSGVRTQDVEAGLLATNQGAEEVGRFFRRIALNVEAVLNGENLSSLPVLVELSQTLTINLRTAHALGISPRFSLLTTTAFVGDYENPLAVETYSLSELIGEVLRENLALESARKDLSLAEQDTRTAWSSYLPSLSSSVAGNMVDPDLAQLSAGQNPQYSAQGQLSLSQALFSPAANASISIQRSLARARGQEFRAAELDLILDAGNAYFNGG